MAKSSVGIKAHFAGFIEPALATSIEKPPKGARWIHEIKFDGYRVQVHIANGSVKVFTQRDNDWTNRSCLLKSNVGSSRRRAN
jgi:bifunctional non-homologous end joining protein LigD